MIKFTFATRKINKLCKRNVYNANKHLFWIRLPLAYLILCTGKHDNDKTVTFH